MPIVEIPASPLVPTDAPVPIRYRDHGNGHPVVILHGGWGYDVYPFDRQIAALSTACRIVVPDRSGYGGSPVIRDLPPDFHHRAAAETRSVIDALDLAAPLLWGHSDGAIIALLIALADSSRVSGLIVEATHLFRHKPSSQAFFERIVADPLSVGARAAAALARDHGERWQHLVVLHSRAWLRIAAEARSPHDDFYDGRLSELKLPALLVHGAADPRTEPGELDALKAALSANVSEPAAGPIHRASQVFEQGGHSPHSERASADAVCAAALEFLRTIGAVEPAAFRRTSHPADPALPASRARRHD